MWWVQSLMKVTIKHKYDMHEPTALQKYTGCLVI